MFHTSLTHIPECEDALDEALRVLRPGGQLAIFDGDYVTTTVATSADDPLQAAVDAAVSALVHEPWLMRRIGALVNRGADVLAGLRTVTPETAEALKAEARKRMAAGTFFGHIAYVSVVARRDCHAPTTRRGSRAARGATRRERR